MISSTDINGPFALMLHHFHNEFHPSGQGSISGDQFGEMLHWLNDNFCLLPAQTWLEKAISNTLGKLDTCVTLDDNLLCQYDIALPVLEKFGLTAIWFVHTSPLEGGGDELELYRYFRTVYFDNIDEFYRSFFGMIKESSYAEIYRKLIKEFDPKSYLYEFPFYSDYDRQYRYTRDNILKPGGTREIMNQLMLKYNFDLSTVANHLWMNKSQLKILHKKGHVLGLHSHTHPTRLAEMPPTAQREEYTKNKKILQQITGIPPICMSHPCTSFNQSTIDILRSLSIKIGFISTMKHKPTNEFEYNRIDHALLV